MRGRKPKPTKLKVLTGNPGKRPLNHNEPRPEPAVPDCPPELSGAAQCEWNRLVGELSKLNLRTHLDRTALAAYCNAYAINVGRDNTGDPEVRFDGEVAERLSGPVALCRDRQSPSRDHAADIRRVRIHAGQSGEDRRAATGAGGVV